MPNHLIAITFCRLEQLMVHQPGRGRRAGSSANSRGRRLEGGVPRRSTGRVTVPPASVLYGALGTFQRGRIKGALQPGVRVTPEANAVRLAPRVRA